ncbi:tetratricopeptide repeat protein [Halomonas binhaiensis]|uniref:Sel1 repeat family protein n=1 Tax=Halomonas binhaiensis TaxID=2562282 RepID=A0A5C1NE62_9GAMM|nr:tetratricopeptide repeat protein [Halomonas binhaiensis]QEM81534.1 sel1 repeat family protein [Halomonas binhaiensis]
MLLSLSAHAEVLYENPVENGPGNDLFESSFQALLNDADRHPVDESSIKAKYLLGLVYLNGSANWNVERDVDKSKKYLLDAWASEAADAGYTLAHIYYMGLGVEKNNKKALEYLNESARMGYLPSQRELGKSYIGYHESWDGLVERDISEGLCWLKKAANAGDLKSARAVAQVYYAGDLVPQDYEAAFDWLKKSSESKYGTDSFAFDSLAMFYEKGLGTEKDLVQAYKYSDLQGTAGVDDKTRLAKEMTQEQVDEAIRLSREWQEKHNTFVPSYDGLEHQSDGSYR